MFLVSLTLSGCSWYTWLCLGVLYILDYVWVFLILTMSGCSWYPWLCLDVPGVLDFVWVCLISLTMSGCSWYPWLWHRPPLRGQYSCHPPGTRTCEPDHKQSHDQRERSHLALKHLKVEKLEVSKFETDYFEENGNICRGIINFKGWFSFKQHNLRQWQVVDLSGSWQAVD